MSGESNLILAAFEARDKPIVLPRPETDENGYVVDGEARDDDVIMVGDEGRIEVEAPPRLIVGCPPAVVTPPRLSLFRAPPSRFLQDTQYTESASRYIRGTLRVESESKDNDELSYADDIGRLLHRRFAKHIRSKIPDTSKHNHPALLFVRGNINRFAALLCFFKQIRNSRVINSKSCLLAHPSCSGFLRATDKELEGSYLHYSEEDYQWIRSGKAVGSDASSPINGLVFRNEHGHKKKAVTASLVDGECFYTLYPSRSNTNQLPNRRGYYEDLTQYCGFSFHRTKNVKGLIAVDEDHSLFDWSMYIKYLDKSNVGGLKTLTEKQLTVVGYSF